MASASSSISYGPPAGYVSSSLSSGPSWVSFSRTSASTWPPIDDSASLQAASAIPSSTLFSAKFQTHAPPARPRPPSHPPPRRRARSTTSFPPPRPARRLPPRAAPILSRAPPPKRPCPCVLPRPPTLVSRSVLRCAYPARSPIGPMKPTRTRRRLPPSLAALGVLLVKVRSPRAHPAHARRLP